MTLERLKQEKDELSKKKVKRTTRHPNDILVHKEYVEIFLRDNKQKLTGVAKADIQDLDIVKRHKWSLSGGDYARTSIDGKTIRMHQLLIKAGKDEVIHHINYSGLDNRRSNLKVTTRIKHDRLKHKRSYERRIYKVKEGELSK